MHKILDNSKKGRIFAANIDDMSKRHRKSVHVWQGNQIYEAAKANQRESFKYDMLRVLVVLAIVAAIVLLPSLFVLIA